MHDKSDFAFEKKIGIAKCLYGNVPQICDLIGKLLFCMKETNEIHSVDCEFFRLDFRQPYLDETFRFPIGSFILDLKWGSKRELEKKSEKEKGNA